MGLEVLPGNSTLWRFFRSVSLRGASRVISISRFTDSLMNAYRVKMENRRVIHPGTRLFPDLPSPQGRARVFGPGAEEVFVCLSLSRLVPRKGIDRVIQATALVVKQRKNFLYCIGGAGPDLARLRRLSAEHGVQKHVHFLGRVSDADLGACYANADLFVLPSRASIEPPDVEGFGIVFLEAAACGTPSLGGTSGGIPEAVLDRETGFLVDPLDPEAIAEKILELMSDRTLLKAISDRARAHALESTWEIACPRYYSALVF
jgi:phosphatidylinositol alpha-1,6-mannosyltransferase